MSAVRSRMVQLPLPFMPKQNAAIVSDCGTYRYTLSRSLDHRGLDDEGLKRCLFVMLNPSIADSFTNDPTIEKCIKLARHWGHHRLDVVNLYAFRATDPKELRSALFGVDRSVVRKVIGPTNDHFIQEYAQLAETVVIAWGAQSPIPERAGDVIRILEGAGRALYCIKQNKDGSPVHPLYQRDDSDLVEFYRRKQL